MESIYKVQISVKSLATLKELERELIIAIQKQGIVKSIHIQQLKLPIRIR